MKIYLLEATEAGSELGPQWERNERFVIAARSSPGARAMARDAAIDEPPEVWTDINLSTCTVVGTAWISAVREPRILAAEGNAS